MISYELAKQLKEVGFPQGVPGFNGIVNIINGETEPTYFPTLEELIEACGDNFGELHHYQNNGDWYAEAKDWVDEQGVGRFNTGSTPAEAVARLWIALNNQE